MRRTCEVEGCGRFRSGRGLCGWHYQRARKGQPLETPHRVRRGTVCDVDGCESGHYARGLCIMHYCRMSSTGDAGPLEALRAANGAGHVTEYGYRVVHALAHPLGERRAQGLVEEHRIVLFDAIGVGPHPCHWCDVVVSWWTEDAATKLQADHVNEDRLDNRPENLVPSCLRCNTTRGRS